MGENQGRDVEDAGKQEGIGGKNQGFATAFAIFGIWERACWGKDAIRPEKLEGGGRKWQFSTRIFPGEIRVGRGSFPAFWPNHSKFFICQTWAGQSAAQMPQPMQRWGFVE